MICIGYSHMVCVLNAAEKAGISFRAVVLKRFKNDTAAGDMGGLTPSVLLLDAGKRDFGSETKALLAGSEEPVFSFIDGSNHVSLPMRRLRGLQGHASEARFDFVLPEESHLPLVDGAEIIPYEAVLDVLRRGLSGRLQTLRRVSELSPARLVQVESPPPVRDRWVKAWLNEGFGDGYAERVELPGRFVRYKLWRVASRIFREQAEQVGARFVEHPREAVDEEGFMRDEFVLNVNHGNLAFGALVLDQLRSLE